MGRRTRNLCDYWRSSHPVISWTKYIYTCCLWFTHFTTGVINKQIGSALPDIQLKTHVPFNEASLYISVFCVGSLVGCLMVGLFYGKVPSTFYLCCACTGLAISEAALPWCDSAGKAYLVHFVIGVCYMSILSIVVAELCALWGNNVSTPMLINALFFGIGGISSSAITAPFLSTTVATMNSTTAYTHRRPKLVDKLYIPFAISATLTSVAAVSHLIFLYKSSRNIITIPYLEFDGRSREKCLPCIRRILVIAIIGTSMLMVGALHTASYILPYFLISAAHLSMSIASYALTLYTTFQVIGRFVGFMLVKKIGNYRLLVGYSVIHLTSQIGLWNCVTYNASVSAILLTISGAGMGNSILQSSMNSFVEETFMPVTGSVSGFLFASSIVGEIIMSTSVGYLIDTFSPLMFIYATVSEIVLFLLFIFMIHYLT